MRRSNRFHGRGLALGIALGSYVAVGACSANSSDTAGSNGLRDGAWTGVAPNMTQASESTVSQWRGLFETSLAQASGVPGVWVAISHPELGHWTGAMGDAVEGARPASTEDHLRIGSITKTFTAVAALEQVDAGTIALDDTVESLVPDLAAQFPEIAGLTIGQLLGMKSGLGDYANVPGGVVARSVEDPTTVWTPEALIELGLESSPIEPPGTPGYSTTNYQIVGRILEAVTGTPVEEILTDLAERAGLSRTALFSGDRNAMPDPSSHGYIDPAGAREVAGVGAVAEPGTDTTDWNISWGGAGGGMHSVIHDLFVWTSSAMGTTLLSKDLGAKRLELDASLGQERRNYGLGIQALTTAEGWVGHTGQVLGWGALGMYNPATGATIAIAMNGTMSIFQFMPDLGQIFELTQR